MTRAQQSNPGESNGRAKLTRNDVMKIRRMRNDGAAYSEIMALFPIGKTTVAHIVHRRLWSHV